MEKSDDQASAQAAVEYNLPPRKAAFVQEYLVDLNATQAAIRAGYSPKAAGVQGYDLLKEPAVADAVAQLQAQRLARVSVTQEQVLHEMSLLANSSLEHYCVNDDGQVVPAEGAPPGCMRAVQSIERKVTFRYSKEGDVLGKTYDVKIKLWDKPAPLKLMGRHTGLFPDKVELSTKDGKPIEVVTRVERVIVRPVQEKIA